tara:strand:+ start:807 stop:1049 length:243 start_codon:yes stop_codon:yes gene_type:complete
MMSYEYIVRESSVDVRTHVITSEEQLTKDEITELICESSLKEGVDELMRSNPYIITMQYRGTEYGSDCQVQCYGDVLEEE